MPEHNDYWSNRRIRELEAELEEAYERGYKDRDVDGQRLYACLALFDVRTGTALADIVQAAREGWERSHVDMGPEDGAWDMYDRLIDRRNELRPRAATSEEQA